MPVNMIPRLYEAAMNGEIDILYRYMEQFEDQLTGNNNTVLHVAAQYGQLPCVEQILRVCRPSLLYMENCKRETPLHIAAREGNLHIVQALVARAKDVESNGREGNFGIVQALIDRVRNLGPVQALKDRAGNPGILKSKELLRATNTDKDTTLHIAVQNGHLEIVTFLAKADSKFSHPANKYKETPLYLAVQRGDSDMVDAIVDNCTSAAYSGPYGRTALHEAAIKSEKPGITTKLLGWKGELNDKRDACGWTALHYAAHGGNVSAVKELLAKNYLLGHMKAGEKDDGKTALHIAATLGNVEVMKEILSACPDCWDMVDSKGRNVLHVVAGMKKEDGIEFIYQHHWFSQLLYQRDSEGNTPLHLLLASELIQLDNNIRHTDVALSQDRASTIHIATQQADYNPQRSTVNWRNMVNNSHDNTAKPKGARTEGLEEKEKAQEDEDKKKDEKVKKMGKTETHMLVATLIATITFAAGFAIPGGYDGNQGPNQGMAVLVKDAAFKIFVITNTIAALCSTSSVFQYFLASAWPDEGRLIQVYAEAFNLELIAMVAMMAAFISGTYAMLSDSLGLAIATSVIGGVFLYKFFGEIGILVLQLGMSVVLTPLSDLKKVFCN